MQERHGQDKQSPCDTDEGNAEEDRGMQCWKGRIRCENQDVCRARESSTLSHRSTYIQLSIITWNIELMRDKIMFAEVINV